MWHVGSAYQVAAICLNGRKEYSMRKHRTPGRDRDVIGTASEPREWLPPAPGLAASFLPATSRPRLLDRVREAVRTRHYSPRTETAYVAWIKRYIFFYRGQRHPAEMGVAEVRVFLTSLAIRDGKGQKDRVTMLPARVGTPLRAHRERVLGQHDQDLKAGHGSVELPRRRSGSTRARPGNGRGSGCSRRRVSTCTPRGDGDGTTCTSR
jgi:hypothetical protein